MKNALIFFLMAVMGLGLASRGEAAFRISGLRCVRSMPDQEPCSKTAPQATGTQEKGIRQRSRAHEVGVRGIAAGAAGGSAKP